MDSFEAIINMLTVLTVLSVAAERITNVVKLRRHREWKNDEDRKREVSITWTTMAAGVGLALVMKADLFEMFARADAPWATLGWTAWDGHHWVRATALNGGAGFAQALLGCAVTGISLGFGSTFWHDTLGAVLELRNLVKYRSAAEARKLVSAGPNDAKGE